MTVAIWNPDVVRSPELTMADGCSDAWRPLVEEDAKEAVNSSKCFSLSPPKSPQLFLEEVADLSQVPAQLGYSALWVSEGDGTGFSLGIAGIPVYAVPQSPLVVLRKCGTG